MMAARSTSKAGPDAADEPPARERILEAAFSAFMESGFAEASTLEIATRARVSKRELYALVGSKQDMLVACIGPRARGRAGADLGRNRDQPRRLERHHEQGPVGRTSRRPACRDDRAFCRAIVGQPDDEPAASHRRSA